jgi:hypothetical protein
MVFLGMLGSINCMNLEWNNCPVVCYGMYTDHKQEPAIISEAIASNDLGYGICFGLPKSHNDINVLHRSPLFAKLVEGQAPEVNFSINGDDYSMGYYPANVIYPSRAALFVSSIPQPSGAKRTYFAKARAAMKDVEHTFGVLQSCFAIA